LGFDFLSEKARTLNSAVLKNGLTLSMVLFVGIDLFMVNSPIFKNAFTVPPRSIVSKIQFTRKRGDFIPTNTIRSDLYPSFLANEGTTDRKEPMPVNSRASATNDSDYKGEVYLASGTPRVKLLNFTPNEIKVELSVTGKDTLVLNQNYYKGWRAIKNGQVFCAANYGGLTSIEVRPDIKMVTFFYWPDDFVIGFFISFITVITFLFLLIMAIKQTLIR
jgi:hypothetical protein